MPILAVVPGLKNGRVVGAPVEITQIAPTILFLLGLNPKDLQAVRIEGTKVLPQPGRQRRALTANIVDRYRMGTGPPACRRPHRVVPGFTGRKSGPWA